MCQATTTTTKTSSTRQRQSRGPVNGILKQRTLEASLSSRRSLSPVRRALPRRSCSFDLVEIREHQIILDKSASSSPGDGVQAALTVSWKPVSTEVTTVQDYEITRPRRQSSIRRLEQEERVALLMSAGYKLEDICRRYGDKSSSCHSYTPGKSKTKSSKPKAKTETKTKTKASSKTEAKEENSTRTIFSRVRTVAKKMAKSNDSARVALSTAAA